MKKIDFQPIPGTRGYITPNGVELIITHGNFEKIRKLCTVVNKSIVFQLKRAQKNLAYFEECLKSVNSDLGSGSTRGLVLEDKIEERRKEVESLRSQLKKEYWADRDDNTLSLPSGFWWMCESIEGNTHLNTEVPYLEIPTIDGKAPRPYQVEVVQELLKHKRAFCELPTGTGKSLCIAMICHAMVQAGKRVCIIEPTVELVDQTTEFVKKYFDKTCAVGGGKKFKPGSMVCITTIHSALENIDKFDCITVDEAHHSAATTYNDTLFMALSAKYFYGFTACSDRADGMSLGIHAACGPIVYEKDTKWAIANGYLTKPRIIIVEISGIGFWKKDLQMAIAYKNIMKNPKVLKSVMDLIQKSLAKDHKMLVMYKTVQAGEALSKWAKANRGVEFSVASSKFRDPLRKFRNGHNDLLVSNSGLLAEGVDLPRITALINCTQNSSENLTRQILGRGLRLFPGKEEVVFVDVVCTGYEQFERAAQARIKIYQTITDDIRYLRL